MDIKRNILLAWRDCSAKQVEKINQWLGEPLSNIEIPQDLQMKDLHPAVQQSGEPESVPSQSSNASELFLKLCDKLAEMVKEYDLMATQMPDGESKDLMADISEQIIASMVLGGCQSITKEVAFDSLRHTAVPFSIVEDGTPIASTMRVGVAYNGRVLVKALVKVCTDKTNN